MKQAIDNFSYCMERASDVHALFEGLEGNVAPILRLDDLLRFEIVQSVSALDALVHELALFGMLEIVEGIRSPTPQFHKFPFCAHSVLEFRKTGNVNLLANDIIEKHSYVSFQHPDKIADAVRLISEVELWNEVGAKLGRKPNDLKRELSLIGDRRNKIVHEGDLDPSFPSQQWPLLPIHAEEARILVHQVGLAIFDVI